LAATSIAKNRTSANDPTDILAINKILCLSIMVNATASGLSSSANDRSPKLSLKSLIQRVFGPVVSRIEISTPKTARLICELIPSNCPFEKDVFLLGRKLFHIPALCKLNPLYEEFIELRFRALVFLADECGEDVTPYCQ
jgi:Mo-dependent nitrogenase C-terminus